MTTPTISVIMAVKNEMPHLVQSVQSILDQTFGDFEFIIVDDKSTDGTKSYLDSLKDPRIHIQDNKGVGQTAGLNQALHAARGEWIARMDGDDWAHPKRFSDQLYVAQQKINTVLVSSDYTICDENLNPLAPVQLDPFQPSQLSKYLHSKNNPFCHPSMMFKRRNALEAGGYDEMLKNAQDYKLWKFLFSNDTWAHVPASRLYYRVRRQSLSVYRAPEQESERKFLTGSKNSPEATTRKATPRQVEGIYAYKLGFSSWLAGKRGAAFRYFLKSIFNGFRTLRSLTLIGLMVLPRWLYLKISGYSGVYR